LARKHSTIPITTKLWSAAVPAGLIAILFLLPRSETRFGDEKFQQLRAGMTAAEVKTILGVPPGDYRPALWKEPPWFISPSDKIAFLRDQRGRSLDELDEMDREDTEIWVKSARPMPPPPGQMSKRWWLARSSGILVAFDQGGLAIHYSLWDVVPPRPPNDILNGIRYILEW
jgi:hypothetical protein